MAHSLGLVEVALLYHGTGSGARSGTMKLRRAATERSRSRLCRRSGHSRLPVGLASKALSGIDQRLRRHATGEMQADAGHEHAA